MHRCRPRAARTLASGSEVLFARVGAVLSPRSAYAGPRGSRRARHQRSSGGVGGATRRPRWVAVRGQVPCGRQRDECERIKALERENRELRQANEILRKPSVCFAFGTRPPAADMIAFIDELRVVYAVEPICRVLPIAPSTHQIHAARQPEPGKLPARARSDAALMVEIRRVSEANFHVYGVRKVWQQLGREGIAVARRLSEQQVRCRK